MSIQLPSKPWNEGDTFTNDATGVEYTFDGVKWLASGGEEADLSGFATKSDVDGCLKLTGGQMTGDLSTQNLDMGAGHAIMQNGVEKISIDGRVVILPAGRADVDGFCIKGRTVNGFDTDLMSVFHNSSGNDAVNYNGKQGSPKNIVTNQWVADRIAEISPPPVHYGLVSFKAHAAHVSEGYEGCWWATDADGNATTGTGEIASIYYHVPAGHYILKSIGTTDVGEIMIFNDGFVLRYHGMAKKTSIKDNIIKIDVDLKEGSGSMAYGGIFTLDIMNCFRETSK